MRNRRDADWQPMLRTQMAAPTISVGRPSGTIRIHQSFLASVSSTNGPTPKAEVATPVRFGAQRPAANRFIPEISPPPNPAARNSIVSSTMP
jgi:hypothetical protein